MNHWKIIYSAHINKSSQSTLFANTIKHGTKWDTFFLTFNLIVFILGAFFYFTKFEVGISFMLIIAGEIGLLYKLDRLKQSLVLDEYGDANTAQTPHNNRNLQTSRYLMFKQDLSSNHISKSHVKDCFDLIETQIDISESTGTSVRKFSSFGFGIFLGVLGTFWKKLETTELIYVGLTLLAVGIFVGFIISLFPSRIERLKEMKYFMQLYCREISL